MSGEEFIITVSKDGVRSVHNPGDRTEPEIPITVDQLHLETIDLLEQWLKRWEWIAKAGENRAGENDAAGQLRRRGGSRLLVPGTFRVLGTHLWRLVLNNRVGEALVAAHDATQAGEPLRVLISFEDSVKQLAGLPWEFLYYPDSPGRRGFFLALETNLILSRYLPVSRSKIRPAEQSLRVIFLMTLPQRTEFNDERDGFKAMIENLRALGPVLDVDPIDGWRPMELVEKLKHKADIVHVVGVCRGDGGSQKLYLDSDDTPGFQDSEPLIEAMVRNRANRPELVVLHLCDWPDSDASESFERLAPELIRAGIPAVLAMQYPMAPGAATSFVTEFYDELADGTDIGKAVQSARATMFFGSRPLNRGFGTPVLYMQSVEGQLLAAPGPAGSSLLVDPAPAVVSPAVVPATGDPGARIRQRLLEVVDENSPDLDTAEEVADWIRATSWSGDRTADWTSIRGRARDQLDVPRLRPLYAAMLRAVREAP